MQGLLLVILMDVVELVPSVSFSPRTNYIDECLTEHIQMITCFDFFKRTSVVAEEITSLSLTPSLG